MFLSLFYDVGCYVFLEFPNIVDHNGQVLGGVPVTLSRMYLTNQKHPVRKKSARPIRSSSINITICGYKI